MTLVDIIPDSLRDHFRSIARDRHMSLEAVVAEALGEYVVAHGDLKPPGSEAAAVAAGGPISLPVCGDPTKALTWDEMKPIIEQADLQDDLRRLGMHDDAADGR